MDTEQTKKSALVIATLNSFITPFMGSSINVAVPVIGKELQMDAVMLTWVGTAYLMAVAVFLVPSGKLGDIYGRKKIFTVGIIVFTISSVFCAVSFSTSMLVVFRVIQGVGNAWSLQQVWRSLSPYTHPIKGESSWVLMGRLFT